MKKQFVYSVREHNSRLRDVTEPFFWSLDQQKAIEVAKSTPPDWSYDQRFVCEHPLNQRIKRYWERPVEVWHRPVEEAKALRAQWALESQVRKVRQDKKTALLDAAMSPAQKKLRKKHGTPAQFAMAAYRTVPEFCSMDEAQAAIDKYNAEWKAAS
jgi:hypothetical protein